MKKRIFIAVACHNRKRIAELCLPTLWAAKREQDHVALYNDASTEYGNDWLRPWAHSVKCLCPKPIGIESQRKIHLFDFVESGCDLLYFTDHDTITDPTAFDALIDIQESHGSPLVCGYNTMAHVRLTGNTLDDKSSPRVIWRHYAPGVSYLLTRAHVMRLMPHMLRITNFDWNIPDILGGRCAISRTSYLDHIGFGGDRHPKGAGYDEGDRALNPTPWLVSKRAEIVAKLSP